mmetsp:Transcript_33158/g.70845  ORF Transcript_33158/g.70845 Transcript_33158/m.70845 type:complete len:216 (+) Transcript_33158:246-893(+)
MAWRSFEMARRSRRLEGWSEEKMPCSTHSWAAGKSGTSPTRSDTRTREACAISSRWPRRPKPVTSVHPAEPCSRRHCAAWKLVRSMPRVAAAMAAPGAARRISAAKSTPVPIALVSTSAWLGAIPALDMRPSASAKPVMQKPRESSVPSQVCPPSREQPASLRTEQAPAIIWKSVASTLGSSPKGTTAMASAPTGGAPMAWQSERAWFAASWPKT